jgi:predicted aspartyl protease
VTRLIGALAAVVALTTLSSPAVAEIYRYTDASGTSHYVEGLDSVPQEFRARAAPVVLPTLPRMTTAPATDAAPAGPSSARTSASNPGKGGTTIKYTPGEPIWVDVKINGTTSARLLLDTGADSTMINPRALVAAGASLSRPLGTTRMTGVTGSDSVSIVVIDSLEVGEARVGRMQVASYDMAGSRGNDGLLGRDFLDRFTVNIDSTNGIVTLSPK